MSDVTGAPGSPPRSRPTTVTIASYLLYLVALLQVVNAIVTFSNVGTISRVTKDWAAGTNAEAAGNIAGPSAIAGAVIGLIIGAGLAVLAAFINRGRNGARITTWVLGGVLLCCTGFGVVGNALSSSMTGGGTAGGPDPKELERRLNDELPSWYGPVTTTTAIITLLALIGVIVLLALPPSNEFFRKPKEVWEPPVPGYPTYQPPPGAPGAPGQPGAPGTPGAPPPPPPS